MRIGWFLLALTGFAELGAGTGHAQYHPPSTVRTVAKPVAPPPALHGGSVGGPNGKRQGVGGVPGKSGGINGTVRPRV
jgi:hypothetical protein